MQTLTKLIAIGHALAMRAPFGVVALSHTSGAFEKLATLAAALRLGGVEVKRL